MPSLKAESYVTTDFLSAWFSPRMPRTEYWGITIGNTRNGINSPRKFAPASVTQTLENWITSLGESLPVFLRAMNGSALLYPLWTIPNTPLLTENNYTKSTVGTPGFWFDIPEIGQGDLELFLLGLGGEVVDLRPTMVTGYPASAMSDGEDSGIYRSIRLWWPLPEDERVEPVGLNIVRLAHGRLMKRKFMRFNSSAVGELLPARPTMHEMSYPLPGVNGCAVLEWRSGSQAMSSELWMHLQMLADEHNEYWNEIVNDLDVIPHGNTSLINAQSEVNALPWDAILMPAGWQMASMGSDPWVSYWTAPGVPDLVVAHTDKEHLILHTAHWASGLVGLWDLGIPLTKWVVAATLAADGNGTALANRYLRTGRIY